MDHTPGQICHKHTWVWVVNQLTQHLDWCSGCGAIRTVQGEDTINTVYPQSPAMRALEQLTPGGSEFVGEVENCTRFIKGRLDSQWETIKRLTHEKRAAQEQIEEMLR